MSLRTNCYYKASSLEDAFQKLKENPKNAIVAGGLWMKKTGLSYETLIDLSECGLEQIKEENETRLLIGDLNRQMHKSVFKTAADHLRESGNDTKRGK